MNHGDGDAASALLRRLLVTVALVPAVLGVSLVGADEARAQAGITDLPGSPSMDAESDPFPYDPRRSLRDYLKVRLPSQWWSTEPETSLGILSTVIQIPDAWQGNPTTAMMRLCPPRESTLWQHVREINMTPFYRKARYAGVTCRK